VTGHKEKIIASGLGFVEGPVALADSSLLFVEIDSQTVKKLQPDGGIELICTTGGGPNGLAIGPNNYLFICNNGGFSWRHEHGMTLPKPAVEPRDYSGGRIEKYAFDNKLLEVIYTGTKDGPLNGPNDIVFDSDGGFWFTDLGKSRDATADRGSVYYAKADGSYIERVLHPLITPNGIGLSPDGRSLYVAESWTSRLWRFDITEPGKIDRKEWPSPNGGELVYGAPGYQIFDSLAVEENGNICVGSLHEGCISVISPEGNLVEAVKCPDPFPTNICFDRNSPSTAYITLSGAGKVMKRHWARDGLKLQF